MNMEAEFLLGEDDEEEKELGRKFYGVVPGTVMPFIPDPQALGRVKVQIPAIDSLDTIAWARVASPAAGIFSGTYFIPKPGDEVLVAFEHGDVNAPYIIGSLWNNINRPPLPLSELQIRTIRTMAGNQIVFTEAPPAIVIQTPAPPSVAPMPPSPVGPHATVTVMTDLVDTAAKLVTIRSGANNVIMSPDGITLQAGSSVVRVASDGITITAGGNFISLGPTGIVIKGSMVHINPV